MTYLVAKKPTKIDANVKLEIGNKYIINKSEKIVTVKWTDDVYVLVRYDSKKFYVYEIAKHDWQEYKTEYILENKDLIVGHTYIQETMPCTAVEILAKDKHNAVAYLSNGNLTTCISGMWKEYQEPDIFDGIEVGDMVLVEFKDGTDNICGFLVERDYEYEGMEEEPFLCFSVRNNRQEYFKEAKANIKSITKLVPEVK